MIDFFKKYIKSYTVQALFIANYLFVPVIIFAIQDLENAPSDRLCGAETCGAVASEILSIVWLAIFIFNIISFFLFPKIETFFRQKLDIMERAEPAKFQYFFFIINLPVFIFNTFNMPIWILYGTILGIYSRVTGLYPAS